jgi:DNA-directed RNA polymerase subunit K/omega
MIDTSNVSPSIKSINILELSKKTNNIYKTVAILGKRANQVGGKMKEQLQSKLQEFTTSGDSLEEFQENREQIEIARHYESLPKPTLIALNEFLEGRIVFEDPEEEVI